jgi:hypothetical protein
MRYPKWSQIQWNIFVWLGLAFIRNEKNNWNSDFLKNAVLSFGIESQLWRKHRWKKMHGQKFIVQKITEKLHPNHVGKQNILTSMHEMPQNMNI